MRRRNRQAETKVWHNPLVAGGPGGAQAAEGSPPNHQQDPREEAKRQRRGNARIIAKPATTSDPDECERERLLGRLRAAEGRPAITAAAGAFREAGFELPNEQGVWLQLLEHSDESVVTEAIKKLSELFDEQEEVPERQAVLDSRLRRIAEYADEPSTQEAASKLQRRLAAHKVSDL
jgi:hypothetical protein